MSSGFFYVYFEGTYLGKTNVDLSTVGDTLPLSLGKDNSISISRKLSKEYNSKNFFGINRTETKRFDIIVRNTKRIPVNILLQDQFPVSVTKEIDISNQKASGAQLDKDSGIAIWNFQLAPGDEKTLNLSYEVKYPKDKRVVLE